MIRDGTAGQVRYESIGCGTARLGRRDVVRKRCHQVVIRPGGMALGAAGMVRTEKDQYGEVRLGRRGKYGLARTK